MSQSNLKRNLSWTTIGMVLYNMAIWVLSALTLRMLGAEMSGYYAVAASIGNTLYAVALWGMRSFVATDQSQEYSYSEYCGARLIGIAISAVLLIGILLVSKYDSTQILVLTLYSVFKFTEALIELLDCFMQQRKEMDINAKSMVIRSVVFITTFFGALKFTKSLVVGLSLILLLSLVVFLFYNLRLVKKKISLSKVVFDTHTWNVIRQCFPVMMFEMLAAAIVAIPRLRFEQIGSLDALGIYTSIYTMVVFLQLVINVLIYTFAPYMAEAWQNKDTGKFWKYTGILFAGSLGLGLLAELAVLLLGKPVIGLLYGAEAAPYYTYLYIGIVSGVTLAWTWIVSQLLTILRHTYDLLVCSVFSTAGCFLLSYGMVNAADCNSMSVVCIGTNLIFLICAVVILFLRRKEKQA